MAFLNGFTDNLLMLDQIPIINKTCDFRGCYPLPAHYLLCPFSFNLLGKSFQWTVCPVLFQISDRVSNIFLQF